MPQNNTNPVFTIHQGMNQDILKQYPDNYFDSIVTDPPYGIEFLGKDWDKNTGAIETWQECFRVLKPGGHLLAFSAARTYHHLATNIENVGFEIRDQIMWIYGSGFPKAQDIGKAIDKRMGKEHKSHTVEDCVPETPTRFMKSMACRVCGTTSKANHTSGFYCGHNQEVELEHPEAQQWSGWKTALKPAHEPIVMARKPFKGSTIDNVLEHGVGALNIDATRIDNLSEKEKNWTPQRQSSKSNIYLGGAKPGDEQSMYNNAGRFPSNVVGEIPDYQKYFYCPKVSRAERHAGFEQKNIPITKVGMLEHSYDPNMKGMDWHDYKQAQHTQGNNHPTVKPVELMKYLIKLVTPAGGRVLDPFNGSGSTGMAAVELGYEYTGCELDPNYVAIAERRITGWYERTSPNNTYKDLFEEDE